MSTTVYEQVSRPRKSTLLWLGPIQAASLFTVWAIVSGGQTLRAWILTALLWLMTLPLLVSLESTLIAMMSFEPLRGLIRRAQYLIVDYTGDDPIHLLTPLVTLMALVMLLRSQRLNMFRATPLAGSVSVLGLIFVLEVFNPLQGGLLIGLSGALFMLVPLVWFYFGQSVSEKFIHTALRLVVLAGIVASLYGVYQMIFGYPAFEQYWIDNTDFYSSIAVGHVRRAVATFSSAEEWGRYTEIGAIVAFGLAAGANKFSARIGWLICGLASLCAVLLSGQRTAVFGLMLGIATLVLLGASTLPRAVMRIGLLLLPVVLIVAFVSPPTDSDMWSKGDNETVSTLLSHTQRGTLKPSEEESLQVRLENWKILVTQVIPYRPLGAGLGVGSLSEMRFSQGSDLPPIDSFILVLAVACGIPGVLLFVWILSRATWLSLRTARRTATSARNANINRIVAALMPALILNSMFGLTFTIYSVAPVAWLLIGWISAETKRIPIEAEREILTI
ncbi:MAG TPA: O-antigen ligase family protein [Pyrinomonadaceae bacterium]|nr:O-antigen ligase family protein [Pyrinomonadaceae bacterium]